MTPFRILAAGLVLVALLAVPAPLLPPHRVAEAVQAASGIGWKAAYLLAAIGLQTLFYLTLGALAALSVGPAATPRGRVVQVLLVPLTVVGIALLIRSGKAGHLPVWTNAVVPVLACTVGVGIGLSLLHRSWAAALAVTAPILALSLWGLLSAPSSSLARATEAGLRRIAVPGNAAVEGDERFGRLLQAALAGASDGGTGAVVHNRAAILALGIAIGDARLARLVGLERDTALLQRAVRAGEGASLRGREDWAKHFTVSAALSVLEHPLVSDAAGLMKEQLDALAAGGTGFSFGDLAADRAGTRFAMAATHSDAGARAMQGRLHAGFVLDDFFPDVTDLAENLTVEEFRRGFGGVGDARYRRLIAEIESRLDRCPALHPVR